MKTKEFQEFQFKMYLLSEAMKKRVLGKIPFNLFKQLDLNERASVLLGLIKSQEKH
jgi:hypothetical protein